MGSTGSSEEPGLSWVLLKRELWGGGQPLSRSYHKPPTSQPPPASEHPGDRATAAVLEQGFGAQRAPSPCQSHSGSPQPGSSLSATLQSPAQSLIPGFGAMAFALQPSGSPLGMGRSELSGILEESVSHKELSPDVSQGRGDSSPRTSSALPPGGVGVGGEDPGPRDPSPLGLICQWGKRGVGPREALEEAKNIRGSCTDGALHSWVGKGGSGWGAERGELRSCSAAPASCSFGT